VYLEKKMPRRGEKRKREETAVSSFSFSSVSSFFQPIADVWTSLISEKRPPQPTIQSYTPHLKHPPPPQSLPPLLSYDNEKENEKEEEEDVFLSIRKQKRPRLEVSPVSSLVSPSYSCDWKEGECESECRWQTDYHLKLGDHFKEIHSLSYRRAADRTTKITKITTHKTTLFRRGQKGAKARKGRVGHKGGRPILITKQQEVEVLKKVRALRAPNGIDDSVRCVVPTATVVRICMENPPTPLLPQDREGPSMWTVRRMLARANHNIKKPQPIEVERVMNQKPQEWARYFYNVAYIRQRIKEPGQLLGFDEVG